MGPAGTMPPPRRAHDRTEDVSAERHSLLPSRSHVGPTPLLPDHGHRVREQQARCAHPLRGDRRRRHRALAPDARRRHAVPDRDRRALDQHRPDRDRRGAADARVRRREGRLLQGRRGRPRDQPGPLHPDDRSGPHPGCPGARRSAPTPTATSISARTRAGIAPTRASGTRPTSRRPPAARSARTIPRSRSSG